MAEPMKIQKQVKQYSGTVFNVNLDDSTVYCLKKLQDEHLKRGGNFSQNVLIRRAIRSYLDFLHYHCPDYDQELIQLNRASKGVL